MLTILSPAKTLDFDSPATTNMATTPIFIDDAAVIMDSLKEYRADDLAQLMKINANLSEQNAERNRRWSIDAHCRNGSTGLTEAKQALFAFRGDVYRGLEAERLSPQEIEYAQEHIRILSGLYGYLKPLDLILPHRLEMGTRLPSPRGSTLYDFWNDSISRQIAQELENHTNPVLLNLASQEYWTAVRRRKVHLSVVTPVFKERRGDTLRVVGVYAKQQRGKMARYIVEQGIDTPQPLKRYSLDGYNFAPELSTAAEWVFVR